MHRHPQGAEQLMAFMLHSRLSTACLHTLMTQGQVKQIVGSSLTESSEDKYVHDVLAQFGMHWHFAFFDCSHSSTCTGGWSPTLHQKSLLNIMLVFTSKMTCQEATSSCWEQMMQAGNKVLVSQ